MERKIYEIWLAQACTPGSPSFAKLVEKFGSAEEIYNATEKQIRSTVGSTTSDCARLNEKSLDEAERIYEFCVTKGVGMLSYFDKDFPLALKDIPTPPVLLYYRGTLPDFNKGFYCAVVGTRYPSDYGRINTFKFAYEMALCRAIIVSGMAIGIDGVAHAGALAVGAKTVAVLGSGIDVCYPPIHQTLARGIVKDGCILTEYAPGTRPLKHHFPVRNRLISGLCQATVVMEGRVNSGSLLTARHARAQGRRVFAYPGNINNECSEIPNLLIKTGATLCEAAIDIICDKEWEMSPWLDPSPLSVRRKINMNAALSEYKVSATTPSDDIFRVPYAKSTPKKEKVEQPLEKAERVQASPVVKSAIPKVETVIPEVPRANPTPENESPLPMIDAEAIRIYKKIPMDTDCPIESLVDEKIDLRGVMKLLLKLEMSRFVVMIPGDRVKRNLK